MERPTYRLNNIVGVQGAPQILASYRSRRVQAEYRRDGSDCGCECVGDDRCQESICPKDERTDEPDNCGHLVGEDG